jgi:hypothetical protein
MSCIRNFCEQDIPQVAALHRRLMRTDTATASAFRQKSDLMGSYARYFGSVFLNDTNDRGLSSFVYEQDGRIRGFLGVVARRMRFRGEPILAAVCSQFVVDPAERGQVGLQMLKRCFEGPQDLSITDEAGDDTRRIWEWRGGATVLPYSIHWLRPLRPVQSALTFARQRKALASVAGLLSPLARALDAVVTRPAGGPFRPARPRGSREGLDPTTLLACLGEVTGDRSIVPDYDERSLTRIVERTRDRMNGGRLRQFLVRDDRERVAGWFVYGAHRGGIGEVLQVAAKPLHARKVLDHLVDDAWQQGVVALSGRLDPDFAAELSEKSCFLYRRGHWTLVHSKRPDVSHALQRGDAFFTRLEGEWCLRFP